MLRHLPPPQVAVRVLAGGAARYCDLAGAGVARSEINRLLRAGTLVRVRRGIYALATVHEARQAALAHGGIPACVTAGNLLGLWTPEAAGVHVWMAEGGHEYPHVGCACVTHWDGAAPVQPSELPTVPRTLLQIARCQPAEVFFAALESALKQQVLSSTQRAWLRRSVPPALRQSVDEARSNADSGLESIVRFRLLRVGVRVRSQVYVRGVGRVDFLLGNSLILEVDGRENHDGELKRHKDLVRDAKSAALGFETLRYDYALIMYQWHLVEAAIRAKIATGAHLR